MKQFAVIGLGAFGKCMVEELIKYHCEVMIIDRDETIIDQLKDKVTTAYVADAFNEEVIRKLIPPTLDHAIVDLGGIIEISVLVTNYLKKIGVKSIVARAESEKHAEILKLLGATRVVFPTREAAMKISPILVSSELFNYLPMGNGLVIAEINAPKEMVGLTLAESDIRKKRNINIIACRKADTTHFFFIPADYRIESEDILLAFGEESTFINISSIEPAKQRKDASFFARLFNRRK